jgi:hypothetical protein
MPAFASKIVTASFDSRGRSRVKRGATFSTEALADRGYRATIGTPVLERRTAIFTEFLTGRVVTPAIRTAQRHLGKSPLLFTQHLLRNRVNSIFKIVCHKFHCRIVSAVGSNSRASSLMPRPVRANSRIRRRYSGAYGLQRVFVSYRAAIHLARARIFTALLLVTQLSSLGPKDRLRMSAYLAAEFVFITIDTNTIWC